MGFPTVRDLTFVTVCFADGESRNHLILKRDVARLEKSYRERYGRKIEMITTAVPNFYAIKRHKGAPISEIRAYAENVIWKAPGVCKRDWQRHLSSKSIDSYP